MAATVLVVHHDDMRVADDVRGALERLGYRVADTAASRLQHAAPADDLRPDLVVFDGRGNGDPPTPRSPLAPGVQGATGGPEPLPRGQGDLRDPAELRNAFKIPVVFLGSPFLRAPRTAESPTAGRGEPLPCAALFDRPDDRNLRTAIDLARALAACVPPAGAERLAAVLDAVGEGVLIVDPSGAVTFLNGAAAELTGHAAADAIGQPLARVVDLQGPATEPGEGASPGARAPGAERERLLVRKDGARRSVEDAARPLPTEGDEAGGSVVVLRDVTERRRLEQRLARSERLASIGTMAAGMAHEINNPLAYVIANVGLVVEGLLEAIAALAPGDPTTAAQLRELLDALREANEGAERVRRIVHDLQKLARVESGSRAVVDVREVLDAAIRNAASTMREPEHPAHEPRLRKQYGAAPLVLANEGQLTQVFTNILVNAAQAVAKCDAERQEIVVSTRTDPLGRAVVEVHDRGPGIPPEILPRIFDPFFTAKPAGAGMGLGLAICQNVVSSLGGEITAESARETGTTFRVALPPTRSTSTRTRAAPPQPTPGRRGRVLVVDDETAVANSVARMLRAQHEVVIETEPRRALARLLAGEGYDVIFCDLMMPSLSGIDLYRGLAGSAPEQAKRVVFMTGGATSPHAQAFLESVGNVSVPKPFTIQAIRAIVNDYVK